VVTLLARLPPDWTQLLKDRLLSAPEHRPEFWRIGGTDQSPTEPMRAALGNSPKPAAVLIPIIDRGADSTLLFTRRSNALRNHAGQISFPGGRLDDSDMDPLAAAKRETFEEIGVHERYVEPLGFLADHVVLTGYRITPVVARISPGFELRLASDEVESVFEVPLAYAMHAGNFQLTRRQLRGFDVETWDLLYGSDVIWGATAGILRHLSQRFSGYRE
jgi:8-oxo-dGTP pyrophosphatase MutT (NUDIX family)